jgi:hypothetical protein
MVLGLVAAYLLGSSVGKIKGTTVVVEPEKEIFTETPLAQDWSAFDQDPRSFEELLANAKVRQGDIGE